MAKPPSLLQMPELVMGKILENIDFQSIVSLRKVCKDLRNYIDKNSPLSSIQSSIDVHVLSIVISVSYGSNLQVAYEKKRDGCLVRNVNPPNQKLLRNEDAYKIFFKDLQIFLKLQKSPLAHFRVNFGISQDIQVPAGIFDKFYESLKTILETESVRKPIQITDLQMQVFNLSNMISVLPYLDFGSLKTIAVYLRPRFGGTVKIYDEEDLHQFLEYLMQFPNVDVSLRSVTDEDLLFTKNTLLHSSTFQKFIIRVSPIYQPDFNLASIFGPYFIRNGTFKWFFSIPNSNNNNQVLRISNLLRMTYVSFERIELSEVDEGAVIQN